MSRHLVGDAKSWTRTVERALPFMVNRIEYLFSADDPVYGSEVVFRVSSATVEGETYGVRVYQSTSGEQSVTCTCVGSFHGRRCWHAAAALMRCGIVTLEVEVKPEHEAVAIEAIAAD
jgi:hypothetical protein